MKKFLLIVLFIIPTLISKAQVISLDENFNAYCDALGQNYPPLWAEIGMYPSASLGWTCGPTEGRGVTPTTTSPGIVCSNNIGAVNYIDTARLLTPQMNLSFYTGSIYLQFDTKFLNSAGRLSILVSNNYVPGTSSDMNSGNTWTDITSSADPVLNNSGSSTWTTHVVDLTACKASPFYVQFMYTSDATGTATWIIDNVMTTQTPIGTGVPVVEDQSISLKVVGNSTSGQVTLCYSTRAAANCQILMYDILGHIVHKEAINTLPGIHDYTISGLDLHEGMYLVKMDNGAAYSTAKAMIR